MKPQCPTPRVLQTGSSNSEFNVAMQDVADLKASVSVSCIGMCINSNENCLILQYQHVYIRAFVGPFPWMKQCLWGRVALLKD